MKKNILQVIIPIICIIVGAIVNPLSQTMLLPQSKTVYTIDELKGKSGLTYNHITIKNNGKANSTNILVNVDSDPKEIGYNIQEYSLLNPIKKDKNESQIQFSCSSLPPGGMFIITLNGKQSLIDKISINDDKGKARNAIDDKEDTGVVMILVITIMCMIFFIGIVSFIVYKINQNKYDNLKNKVEIQSEEAKERSKKIKEAMEMIGKLEKLIDGDSE